MDTITSPSSQAALPKYEKASIAMISQSTSTSLSGQRNKVFFRAIASNEESGKKLANYATIKDYNNVVVFYNKSDIYSDNLKQEFEKYFQEKGGKIRNINLDDLTLNTSIEKLLDNYQNQANAIVFLPKTQSISVALEIARTQQQRIQEQRASKKLHLLGDAVLYDPEILRSGGEAVEDLVLCVPWFAEEQNSKEFSANAKQRWGGQISSRTAANYDATQAFIKAISMSAENPSRQSVLNNLKSVNLSQNETSGYPLQFNNNGERQQEPVLVKAVRGSGGPQESGFKFEQVKE